LALEFGADIWVFSPCGAYQLLTSLEPHPVTIVLEFTWHKYAPLKVFCFRGNFFEIGYPLRIIYVDVA